MEVKPGYKQTEVGVVPEEWEVKPLGELGRFKNGINKGKEDFGHGSPFINLMDVFGIPKVSASTTEFGLVNSTAAERKLYELKAGDVLFVRSSVKPEGVGLTTLIPEELRETVFSGFLIRFRDAGLLELGFKEHCFWDERFRNRLLSNSTFSANTNINQEALKSLQIAFPRSLTEQRAIAEALSDVDALLGALDRLIAKKRDLKQTAMQQLLTGQTSLPGFQNEWEVKTFGELFDFSGGYSASRDQLSSEGHCYLHYGDIHGATKAVVDVCADYQDIPKLDISLKRVPSKYLLEDGDVVFVDASEDDEGTSRHVVIVNKDKRPFISGLHTIVAKSKTDELTHEYRRYCFQTAAIRQQFLFYAVGTKVSGISKSNISKLALPIPSAPDQAAIADVLMDMDAELEVLERRREKTCDLKQAMMQELLTGRIRLVSAASSGVSLPQEQKGATAKPAHNWQINEAVIIGVLAGQFGTEEWPLPRKRQVKLTYLLHRHVEGKADGYLKKAAGPYNPKTRYQGPEGIALKNRYVRKHNNGTYVGFVAAGKIAQAEQYFVGWYPEAKEWLEQFRFEKTDELELLATVDMAVEDLRSGSRSVELNSVKDVLRAHPDWQAKLSRPIFSDDNITRAIGKCNNLFAS